MFEAMLAILAILVVQMAAITNDIVAFHGKLSNLL